MCVPALSVDAYFAARTKTEREIFEAVQGHLASLGPLIVEAVGVGILFKRQRTFAELRPKTRWVDLGIGLDRRLEDPRITRTSRGSGSRIYHGIRVRSAADVDDQVRAWLTESYVEFAA